MNDYVRIPYANGSSFASQFLYRQFEGRGHDVTVIGPSDPDARPEEMPDKYLCLPSLPLRNHPGVRMPLPSPGSLAKVESLGLDMTIGQTGSELNDLGVWLRWKHDIPFISVNTVHLPSVYNVLLTDRMNESALVQTLFEERIIPAIERHSAHVYNQGDGLVVLSRGLKDYWRNRGVEVPIFVIPRSVDPQIFSRPEEADPFAPSAKKGARLLVVCRQTREKGMQRLLEIFAQNIAPAVPHSTLTVVGDGPDYDVFVRAADELGVADRVYFAGERRLTDMANFYRHADLFVYTSLSETYGQVVSEALWCGLPAVAFDDDKGVAQQIDDGKNGFLIKPGPNESKSDWRFAKEVVTLLRDTQQRKAMAEYAAKEAFERCDPDRCIARYYDAFEQAREHCASTKSARRNKPWQRFSALGRWVSIQSTLLGLGLLRPPTEVNRRRTRQPGWDNDARNQQAVDDEAVLAAAAQL